MSFVTVLLKCCKLTDQELTRSHAYSESNYQAALSHFLQKELSDDFTVSREVHIPYRLSDGFVYGSGRADIICEDRAERNCYILELKANVDGRVLKKYYGQLSRYTKHHPCEYKKTGVVVLFNSNSEPTVKVHYPIKK